MFALLIIPLLVSGCLVVTSTHNFRMYFRLHRYDGQLLYLKAATFGTFAVLFSLLAAFTIKWFWPEFNLATWTSWLIDASKDPKSNRVVSWLILISVASILSAVFFNILSRVTTFLSAHLIARVVSKSAPISRVDAANGEVKEESRDWRFYIQTMRLSALGDVLPNGSLGRLFFDSATRRKDVLITLQSRKVYVGRVKVISEPNEKEGPNQEISITPLLSGYREKDTLSIIFTNDYDGLKDVDTTIVFPLSEVSHASWFNMNTHQAVDNNHTKKNQQSTLPVIQ
ncbi:MULTISPECIES: hypothetical protein [Yersinia]|uniref:Uncharacterized protein n=1 Tax=Yersinia massiliensis TaxID=419257 RepID=A0ABM6UNN7_9GAMM|nr:MULTISPECIES: hypothetical protein [Yersinia]AVX36636.1 hypothetical protein DA391_02520 [Yersinia massiliensis]QKJ11441.1 hypothetical protein HRD68_12345 [Yersinia massiliensis]CQJ26103.1 Uncharacterised protein [Yersinia mollaretii]